MLSDTTPCPLDISATCLLTGTTRVSATSDATPRSSSATTQNQKAFGLHEVATALPGLARKPHLPRLSNGRSAHQTRHHHASDLFMADISPLVWSITTCRPPVLLKFSALGCEFFTLSSLFLSPHLARAFTAPVFPRASPNERLYTFTLTADATLPLLSASTVTVLFVFVALRSQAQPPPSSSTLNLLFPPCIDDPSHPLNKTTCHLGLVCARHCAHSNSSTLHEPEALHHLLRRCWRRIQRTILQDSLAPIGKKQHQLKPHHGGTTLPSTPDMYGLFLTTPAQSIPDCLQLCANVPCPPPHSSSRLI